MNGAAASVGFHLSALRCALFCLTLCFTHAIAKVLTALYTCVKIYTVFLPLSPLTSHQITTRTTQLTTSESHRVHNSPTAQQPYDPAPMALANHSLSEKKQRFTFHPLIAYTPFRYCIFSHTCLKGRPCDPSPQYLRIPFWIWAHQSFPFMPNYPLLPTSSPSLSKRRLAFEGEVIRQHGFGCLFI